MAAAGLQWKYFFAAFEQKRLQRKAGTNAEKYFRSTAPKKTAMSFHRCPISIQKIISQCLLLFFPLLQ